jgi:hypothetical protein
MLKSIPKVEDLHNRIFSQAANENQLQIELTSSQKNEAV